MTKQKRCRICKVPFSPIRPMQTACSMACAIAYGQSKGDKERAKQEREERKECKEKLDAMKTIPQLKKFVERSCHAYIRLRDADKPCISCGGEFAQRVGGSYDAGHFRSRAAADHLRYYTLNIWKQCKYCNKWKGSNREAYEAALVAKIGRDRVDAILNNNGSIKWTREYLLRLHGIFLKKARIIKKLRKSR